MKILFIEPPFDRFIGFRCEWFPMGLVSLATQLKREGYFARVYNAEHDNDLPYVDLESYSNNFHQYRDGLENDKHKIWREIENTLDQFKPDVVGISVKTVKVPSALRIAKIAKRLNPKVKTIAGGTHSTVCPDDLLGTPFIDYVVKGEGEETTLDLIQALNAGKGFREIPGLSYKKESEIKHNRDRPLIKDLQTIAYPDRKLLINYKDYSAMQLGWLMTSRGCPYDCTFCSSKTIWTRKVRYRPLEDVLSEVEELKKVHKVSNLNFMDDSFTVNRRYVSSLCDEFVKSKFKITWSCLTRPDLVDEEIIKKMKSAGCTKVDIGVESGSEKVQKSINKEINLEQVRKMAKMLRENNLFWAGFFMMGFPGETKDDVLATLDFMKEVKPNWVCFSIFTPYPGTAFYDKAKELGLISQKMNFSLYAHQSPDNCFSEKMSPEEFKELAKMMLQEFNRYNASIYSLYRRALTRNYYRNPKLFVIDLKKWLTWMFPLKIKKIIDRNS